MTTLINKIIKNTIMETTGLNKKILEGYFGEEVTEVKGPDLYINGIKFSPYLF